MQIVSGNEAEHEHQPAEFYAILAKHGFTDPERMIGTRVKLVGADFDSVDR